MWKAGYGHIRGKFEEKNNEGKDILKAHLCVCSKKRFASKNKKTWDMKTPDYIMHGNCLLSLGNDEKT